MQYNDKWKAKSVGTAIIYTRKGIDNAVVNRRGWGINSALGYNITFEGKAFPSVDAAIVYAEKKYAGTY